MTAYDPTPPSYDRAERDLRTLGVRAQRLAKDLREFEDQINRADMTDIYGLAPEGAANPVLDIADEVGVLAGHAEMAANDLGTLAEAFEELRTSINNYIAQPSIVLAFEPPDDND